MTPDEITHLLATVQRTDDWLASLNTDTWADLRGNTTWGDQPATEDDTP